MATQYKYIGEERFVNIVDEYCISVIGAMVTFFEVVVLPDGNKKFFGSLNGHNIIDCIYSKEYSYEWKRN